MIKHGSAQGIQVFVEVSAFAVFIIIIGQIGTVELAASNLAFSLNSLAFVPMSGIGMAVMTLVAQRIGEKQPELAVRITYLAFWVAAIYMGTWCLAYFFLPDLLMSPYLLKMSPEEAEPIAALTKQLLWFVIFYAFFDAMAIVFGNAIRGAGDTQFAMLLMLICGLGFFIFPMALTWYFLGGNLWLYWTAATAYIVVLGVGFILRFLGGQWKSMSVIEIETEMNGEQKDEPLPTRTSTPGRTNRHDS